MTQLWPCERHYSFLKMRPENEEREMEDEEEVKEEEEAKANGVIVSECAKRSDRGETYIKRGEEHMISLV
jgi:hypothetical protein